VDVKPLSEGIFVGKVSRQNEVGKFLNFALPTQEYRSPRVISRECPSQCCRIAKFEPSFAHERGMVRQLDKDAISDTRSAGMPIVGFAKSPCRSEMNCSPIVCDLTNNINVKALFTERYSEKG